MKLEIFNKFTKPINIYKMYKTLTWQLASNSLHAEGTKGGGLDLDDISLPLGIVLLNCKDTLTLVLADGCLIRDGGEGKGVLQEAGWLHPQVGQGQTAILHQALDLCYIAHKGSGSLPLFQHQLDENKVPHLKETKRLKNKYKREQPRQLTAYKVSQIG